MRIRDRIGAADVGRKNIQVGKNPSKTAFAVELRHHQSDDEEYQSEIERLSSDIDQYGDQLEKEPTLENFQKFRDLLSKLVTRISNEAYRLEKIGGTPQNPRYYEIITVINNKADQLYGLIVNRQRDRLAITASVIGIKGLVVDLLT